MTRRTWFLSLAGLGVGPVEPQLSIVDLYEREIIRRLPAAAAVKLSDEKLIFWLKANAWRFRR